MAAPTEEPRTRLLALCIALPEVASEGDQHLRFQVRNKTFAYYLEDHHGDGLVALCCKAAPGEAASLIASDPNRFYRPAYSAIEAGSHFDSIRRPWTGTRSRSSWWTPTLSQHPRSSRPS
jgi:hypothetical protein